MEHALLLILQFAAACQAGREYVVIFGEKRSTLFDMPNLIHIALTKRDLPSLVKGTTP
jgi:hypothetical protein